MADLTFPDIRTPSSVNREKKIPMYKAESSTGYLIMRPKGTAAKLHLKLAWDLLPESEFVLLENFFIQAQSGGLTFSYTWPTTGETENGDFVFIDEKLDASIKGSDGLNYTASVNIQEI